MDIINTVYTENCGTKCRQIKQDIDFLPSILYFCTDWIYIKFKAGYSLLITRSVN